jgi:NDP-sugar pyrophosphorylase family protein
LAAKGSVPIGIGKNSHIRRAIIDKNARIGDDVKVIYSFIRFFFSYHILSLLSKYTVFSFFPTLVCMHARRVRERETGF